MDVKLFSSTNCCQRISFIPLLLLCFLSFTKGSVPSSVTIGAIFSSTSETNEDVKAFELAVEHVNNDPATLVSTQLKYILNYTEDRRTLSSIQKACHQISEGVTAIVGPLTSTDIKAITTVTSGLKIPIYSPRATNDAFATDHENYPFLLRMETPDDVTVEAIAQVFVRFLWRRIAILTSNTDYARGVAADFYKKAIEHKWDVVTTQKFIAVHDHRSLDVSPQLTAIIKKGVRIVLVSCSAAYTPSIMKQANELKMINGWAWIVTASGFDAEPQIQEMIGLIGVRARVNEGTLNPVLTRSLRYAGFTANPVSYNANKRFDSVLAFAKGLHDFLQEGGTLSNSSASCESCSENERVSDHGDSLMSYLQQVQINGTSHFLNFSSDRSPGISNLEILNLQSEGWKKIGSWDSIQGLDLDTSHRAIMWPGGSTNNPVDTKYHLENHTLKIVTILEPGFIQLKKGKNATDSDPYEGLCIDLINRMAKDLHFNYTLELVPDCEYGRYNTSSKRWIGMVGELVAKKYDMALSPLKITQSRSTVIDFSKPYMNLGLSILMRIPSKPVVNIFRFLDPLSRDVWVSAFGFMVVVGVISLLLDKISPTGHYGSVVQAELDEGREPKEIEDQLQGLTYMNVTSSMWFSVGALLQQGGDVLPRSISGRTVAAFWWATSMIIIATYTANLTAFLTLNRMKLSINSVEALASQTKVSYGTLKDSVAMELFQNSLLPSYNAMYEFMKSRGTLSESIAEGFERVRKHDVAFIYDSVMLEAEMYRKPCDVFTVGQPFGKFGYGLAFPKNSPYTAPFDMKIYQLREERAILRYKDYWLKKKGECTPDLSVLEPESGQLTREDMIGVLYIVYVGIGAALICVVIELCVASFWEVDPTDPRKPRTWGEAMKRRLGRIWKDFSNALLQKLHDRVKRDRTRSRQSYNVTVREAISVSEMKGETKEQRKEEK